jgi:thiamine biosynthesis lipoprotein
MLFRALFLLPACAVIAGAQTRFDFESVQMATKFRLSLHAETRQAAERAADEAFARVAALTAVFSDYEPQSELSRLCAAPHGVPFASSHDLQALVSRAQEISRLTDGAFDITCGHVSRLWRSMRTRKRVPPPERVAEARARMDWRAVAIDPANKTITLKNPGMLLDMGGIAKGYAADAVLRLLREKHGITRALVIAGGDIAAGDAPPDEAEGWEVKLRTFAAPIGGGAETLESIRLKNAAVSTSGDLYRSAAADGKSYAHIISPQTGLGLTNLTPCSVIAPDATTSDALATALCVLGREKGNPIAARFPGVTVRWGR